MNRRQILQALSAAPLVIIPLATTEAVAKPSTTLPPEAQFVISKYNITKIHHISKWELAIFVKCDQYGVPLYDQDIPQAQPLWPYGVPIQESAQNKMPRLTRVTVPVFDLDDPRLFQNSRQHTLDINIQAAIDVYEKVAPGRNSINDCNLVIVENGLCYGIGCISDYLRLNRDIVKEYGNHA